MFSILAEVDLVAEVDSEAAVVASEDAAEAVAVLEDADINCVLWLFFSVAHRPHKMQSYDMILLIYNLRYIL